MKGRRLAALLCVLLAHAFVIFLLLRMGSEPPPPESALDFASEPITLYLSPPDEEATPAAASPVPAAARHSVTRPAPSQSAPAAVTANAAPSAPVDWPLEGKKAAQRLVERELEAERIAKMFAGPKGTWASLTKRQRSKLNKFRFKPGIDGLEYDEKGNQIYHLGAGCMIVNSMFIACALGKDQIHGDMFENMREYFDEQRMPQTDEGNGTEPEALRPPK